jgi:hypothetical protein
VGQVGFRRFCGFRLGVWPRQPGGQRIHSSHASRDPFRFIQDAVEVAFGEQVDRATTGRPFTYTGAAFFTTARGLITSIWAIGDLDVLRRQLK